MKNLTDNLRSLLRNRLVGGNHATEMQKPTSTKGGNYVSYWRNIRPVPNVSSFKINARLLDQFLIKFNLMRKTGGVVEVHAYKNRDINRYVSHQLRRMDKANDVLFWRIACSMMLRSKSFFVIALNHVYPRWYKTLPWASIVRLYRSFQRRARHEWWEGHFVSTQLSPRLSRVYIEKSGGKYRPLGVPSPSWRIYLHMWASLLSWRYDKNFSNCQHGFRPGRGTATAWQSLIRDVIPARNIYEFDLVSFFDRVNLLSVRSTLMKWGVPEGIADYLVEINRHAIPRFQETDLVDESRLRLREAWREFRDPFYYSGEVLSAVTGTPDDAASELETDLYQGVGQGTATGPFLAAVALENSLFAMGNQMVQYADDGVIYGESIDLRWGRDDGTDASPWRGIDIHPGKSGWVKKDNQWLRPLKFLGLVYDGTTDTLYSDTRSGKRMLFDKSNLLAEMNKEDLGPSTVSPGRHVGRSSFEALVLSRFWGYVQSRLFSGSWNAVEAFQNFHFITSSKSWVRRMRARGGGIIPLSLYNASSVASRSLASFLRNLDTTRRDERWVRRRPEGEVPQRMPVQRSESDSPIRWVMRREWSSAYLRTTFAAFEGWMVYYVSRMLPHSLFSEEQMYVHYSLAYFERRSKRIDDLLRELSIGITFAKAKLVEQGPPPKVRGVLPWLDSLTRKVENLNSEHIRLTTELGAFQQRARRHFTDGSAFKTPDRNSIADYQRLSDPQTKQSLNGL